MKRVFQLLSVGVLFLACFFASCSTQNDSMRMVRKPLETERVKGVRLSDVHSVIVLPLDRALGVNLSKEELMGLSERLVTSFQRNTGISVVNIENPKILPATNVIFSNSSLPFEEKAQKIGKISGAMSVLSGTVSRFTPGGASGDDAHVGFSLSLADANSGSVIWSATFDRGLEPLSSNVLLLGQALKTGVKKRSAAQLFEEGLVESARNFENLRRQEAAR